MVSNSYAKKFLLKSIQQQQRYLAEEEPNEQNSGVSGQDLSKTEEDTTANEFDDEEIDPPENWQSEYDEFVEAEQGEDYEEIIPPRRR